MTVVYSKNRVRQQSSRQEARVRGESEGVPRWGLALQAAKRSLKIPPSHPQLQPGLCQALHPRIKARPRGLHLPSLTRSTVAEACGSRAQLIETTTKCEGREARGDSGRLREKGAAAGLQGVVSQPLVSHKRFARLCRLCHSCVERRLILLQSIDARPHRRARPRREAGGAVAYVPAPPRRPALE